MFEKGEMRLCGHTMGTPKLDIFEAMNLFAQIGYEGIEIRCAADGHLNPEKYSSNWGKRVLKKAKEIGLEIVCLTPYYRDFVRDEKRKLEIAGMKKVIDIAAELGCSKVRAYGGIDIPKGISKKVCWDTTVTGIQTIADYAAKKEIDICIETHAGSLTISATDTVRMVKDVDRKNVGILFDYAWVDYAGKEDIREAVRLASPYLKHVHAKDWIRKGNRTTTKLLGEGELDWRTVLRELHSIGYEGYLSDEYEKYWKDYLPEPEIGMKHNLEYLRSILKQIN